jgi:hypothetical protein
VVKVRQQQPVANTSVDVGGIYPEPLTIGNDSDLDVIVRSWTWGSDGPVYELHDAEKNVAYWVLEIPSPQEAAELLRKHGGPPEEERGKHHRTRTEIPSQSSSTTG